MHCIARGVFFFVAWGIIAPDHWHVGGAVAAPPPVTVGQDGAEMVLVPAGPFIMGAVGEKVRDDESPVRRLNLPAFYIDRCEVTNAQYARYIAATKATPPVSWDGGKPPQGKENCAVTNVTWFDAMRYAVWAGKRLPTEAEWEKAARGTDGRRFPWGNEDDKARRNLDNDGKIRPVGTFPAGASPFGCLDMSGNVWEWTADWYAGYPGTAARSVHFGKQYKVMRGGGGIYFYGIDNRGDCTQRARLVPYGEHDGLGFRCVKDAPGTKAPYDPRKTLAEAESLLKATLREPVTLSYEKEFADLRAKGGFPLRIEGSEGQAGPVRTGVPFPQGVVKDASQVRLLSTDGKPQPVQTTVLARWADGSARWLLLDFAGRAGETCRVEFRGAAKSASPAAPLRVRRTEERVQIETGRVTLVIARDGLVTEVRSSDGVILGPMSLELQAVLSEQGAATRLRPLPAERLDLEDAGDMHATVRLRGVLGGASGEPSPFRYDLRIHAYAGSSRVNALLTLTHFAKRVEPTEKVAPVIKVADATLQFALPQPATQTTFATDHGAKTLPVGRRVELVQPDDLRYTINRDAQTAATGTRAPGWLAAQASTGWAVFGVRHFWQNHPKSLFASPNAIGTRLWAGREAFEWEGGLAKTHEIVLDFAAQSPTGYAMDPLRATVPPAWACGTEAVGPMLPRCREAVERFPYWEVLRESSKRRWVRAMPTGLRDYGDAYMGGPYKGKNAYSNLEYDVPFNFVLDFLKTAQPWYLAAAEAQARHQADIDIEHAAPFQWKHSPQHTTTRADFGHVFVRGLLLHYMLTGERRSLEAAREIGDWLAPEVQALKGIGNERQIGWSLYALAGLYEFTGDEKYLKAAVAGCDKLTAGQSATGKFNIRWDNRISFFNGIAMNGMLAVYRLTNNERLAQTILQVARRTLGFYPEYACRTLDAFVWAARHTKDPRYLDNLERTWLSSMEFLMGRDSGITEEVHAWQFTQLAAKYQLLPLFDRPPEILPDPATWKGVRLDQPNAELYLRNGSNRPAAVMVVLEGTASGRAVLLDAAGKAVQSRDLREDNRFFQVTTFALPPGDGVCRLQLTGAKVKAWQIHRDGATRMTVHDPQSVHLANLYPRAYGYRKPGAREVKLALEVAGEGFHSATLYDPDGNPVTTVRHFVDFEDPKSYKLELKASLDDPRTDGWSLEIYNAKVVRSEGLLPYWACDVNELFQPPR